MKSENDGILFELVDTLCTGSAVQDLLRDYKSLAKDQVRISADSKEDLVKKNLKKAVDAGVVPIGRVHALVRDSEENGNQHIFYFKPRRSVSKDYTDSEAVGRALWGKGWQESKGFPKFTRMPNGTVWGDFRDGAEDKPPCHWVAKLYEKAISLEYLSEEAIDGFLQKRYRRIESRVVLLARGTARLESWKCECHNSHPVGALSRRSSDCGGRLGMASESLTSRRGTCRASGPNSSESKARTRTCTDSATPGFETKTLAWPRSRLSRLTSACSLVRIARGRWVCT